MTLLPALPPARPCTAHRWQQRLAALPPTARGVALAQLLRVEEEGAYVGRLNSTSRHSTGSGGSGGSSSSSTADDGGSSRLGRSPQPGLHAMGDESDADWGAELGGSTDSSSGSNGRDGEEGERGEGWAQGPSVDALAARDKRLVTELVGGVTRWRRRLDFTLAHLTGGWGWMGAHVLNPAPFLFFLFFLGADMACHLAAGGRDLGSLDAPLRVLLRMGLYELLELGQRRWGGGCFIHCPFLCLGPVVHSIDSSIDGFDSVMWHVGCQCHASWCCRWRWRWRCRLPLPLHPTLPPAVAATSSMSTSSCPPPALHPTHAPSPLACPRPRPPPHALATSSMPLPPHTRSHVINEHVELAKTVLHRGAAAFANGVLRSVVRATEEERAREGGAPGLPVPPPPAPGAGPEGVADSLGLAFSHPTWMVQRWLRQYGPRATLALLRHNNA